MRKTRDGKKHNFRTLEYLKIPPKISKNFALNFINISVDYLQYTSYDISTCLKAMYRMGFSGEIDTDNSNVEFNTRQNLSMINIFTKMGHAYIISFLTPGFPPIPIISVEVYGANHQKTLKTQGKIVLYGAYFVFRSTIAEEAPEVLSFANTLELGTLTSQDRKGKPIFKRTRVDIAVDVRTPVDQLWMSQYIQPHKTSKHVAKPYNYVAHLGGWQSISYLPGYRTGIRIYNKLLDIQNKKKFGWYPTYGTDEHPVVTRIELVYRSHHATSSIEDLIEYTKYRILGEDNDISINTRNVPRSEYSPLSAYNYFKLYAKNHGKSFKELLDDVISIFVTQEEREKNFISKN